MILKKLKGRRGFSIMELLAVLAIFMTLSSIAFFSWRKYARKSKSVEAKAHLSLVRASQEQYHKNCRHYYPDLRTIGAIPSGELVYNVGGQYDNSFTSTHDECISGGAKCVDGSNCVNYLHTPGASNNICCDSFGDFKASTSTCPCTFHKPSHIPDVDAYISSVSNTKIFGASPPSGVSKKIKPQSFLIFAVGDLGKKGVQDDYDVWVINHRGSLRHIQIPK